MINLFNHNPEKMELYKINLYSPIAINLPDGAIGYNYVDTHQVILHSGIWHVKGGAYGAAHNEYLAYLIGMEMELPVPETTIYMIPDNALYHYNTRMMQGKSFHSAQRFIIAELGKYFDYTSLEEDILTELIRQIARMDIFDYLIGNDDRHNKNFMIDDKGKLHFIDNGYGGIGNEGMDFVCNRAIPEWIFQKDAYREEILDYQKILPEKLPEDKLKAICSAMKEFDWKTWNCQYEGPYKICHAPEEKTIDEFAEGVLRKIDKMSSNPAIPFPLNCKMPMENFQIIK